MIDHGNNLRKLSALGGNTTSTPPWLWKGYLAPGALTVFSAGYKVGKSTLMTLLYDAMRNGGTLLGEPVAKGNVNVASEEPDRVWMARRQMFDLEGHVEVDVCPFPVSPSPERWKDYVASFLHKPAALDVFDSTLHFLPTNSENDKERLQRAIRELRVLTGVGRSVALLHQPAKGRNCDFNFRGHGVMDGDPEILVEIKVPNGESPTGRRRLLHVRSRLPDYVPPRRMLELNREGTGLVVLPDTGDWFSAGWVALQIVLEDAGERLTFKGVRKAWPPDYAKPSDSTLRRLLDRAVEEQLIERFCQGHCHSPFRYALPGRKFVGPYRVQPPFMHPDQMDRERFGY